MRYAMTINNGPELVGTRAEMQAAFTGVLMTAIGDDDILDLQGLAEVVLKKADQHPAEVIKKETNLGNMEYRTIRVWRERGNSVKGRSYLIRIGEDAPFRTDDTAALATYIAGLMVSDGGTLEKSTALGQHVAYVLSEGGGYPDGVATELRDGRTMRAWFEDTTAGTL